MKVKRFEDLDCWLEARVITRAIYKITTDGSFKKDNSLTDQVRRAATSIMANIAEGFSRQ